MKNTNLNNYISNIDFTFEQKNIFEKIVNQLDEMILSEIPWDNIIALSGAAGTGKTFLITHLIEFLQDKYQIVVTAPTHKALKVIRKNFAQNNINNIDLKTIHSFLNIKLTTNYDNGTQIFKPEKEKNKHIKTDILIIDESSMVSNELYDYIEKSTYEGKVNAVLFVGDYYQLLPIDDNENKIFKIRNQYELKKIVRQAEDSYIINVATNARDMIKNEEYVDLERFLLNNSDSGMKFFTNEIDFYNDFYNNEYWEYEDKIITSFTNKKVDLHNTHIRNKYWKQKGYNKIPHIIPGDKIVFQNALVENEKVLYQNNDEVTVSHAVKVYSESLDIWYWSCKDTYQIAFQVIDPCSYYKYTNELNKIAQKAKKAAYPLNQKLWKKFFDIKNSFIDIKYTYASTIHKLQGSTYQTVYIDLYDVFDNNTLEFNELYRLIYVAITRASKNVKILVPMKVA